MPSYAATILLALPSLVAAVSLSDFTPRVSNLPQACQNVYTSQIVGCSASDFTTGYGCSSGCISAMQNIVPAVQLACSNAGVSGNNPLAAFISGDGVHQLCPNSPSVATSTTQQQQQTPTTTSTTSQDSPTTTSTQQQQQTTPTTTSTTSTQQAATTSATAATTSSTTSATGGQTSKTTSGATTSPAFALGSSTSTRVGSSATSTTAAAAGSSASHTNNSGGGSPFDTVSKGGALRTAPSSWGLIPLVIGALMLLLR